MSYAPQCTLHSKSPDSNTTIVCLGVVQIASTLIDDSLSGFVGKVAALLVLVG